jgi:hypothetical protein
MTVYLLHTCTDTSHKAICTTQHILITVCLKYLTMNAYFIIILLLYYTVLYLVLVGLVVQ